MSTLDDEHMAKSPNLEAEQAWMAEWAGGMVDGYAHDPLTCRDAFRAAYAAGTKSRPRLGVAVMVVKEIAGEPCILLGKSKKVTGRAKWVIPGGGVRRDETIAETGKREILEEAGLVIEIPEFGTEAEREAGEYTHAFPKELLGEEEHRVVLFVEGTVTGGELKAGDDLEAVGFFSRQELFNGAPDLTDLAKQVLEETEWL